MTSPLLDRVRKLLELAAHENTPEDEARNSAVKACKLIVEHKLELRVPGESRIITPDDLEDSIRDFWSWVTGPPDGGQRQGPRTGKWEPPRGSPRRHTYSALCPEFLVLKCTCCGMPVRVGTRFVYVSGPHVIEGPEGRETIARVVHDACVEHWQQDLCSACGKDTRRPKSVRERLRGQRRDPPGTVLSTNSGFCYCCGATYDVDEKVVQRGYAVVHAKCFVHFTKTPCPKCGGGARF